MSGLLTLRLGPSSSSLLRRPAAAARSISHSSSSSSSAAASKQLSPSSASSRAARVLRGSAAAAITYQFLMNESKCMADNSNNNNNNNNNDNNDNTSNSNNNNGSNNGKPDEIERLINQIAPLAAPIGFGGAMGFCAAVAMKKIGKLAAGVIGVGFLTLQGLNYMGYIKLNLSRVQAEATKHLDLDGDGKLTSSDFIILWRRFRAIAEANLPSSGGFSLGFYLGILY